MSIKHHHHRKLSKQPYPPQRFPVNNNFLKVLELFLNKMPLILIVFFFVFLILKAVNFYFGSEKTKKKKVIFVSEKSPEFKKLFEKAKENLGKTEVFLSQKNGESSVKVEEIEKYVGIMTESIEYYLNHKINGELYLCRAELYTILEPDYHKIIDDTTHSLEWEENLSAHYMRGLANYQLKRYEEALEDFNKLPDIHKKYQELEDKVDKCKEKILRFSYDLKAQKENKVLNLDNSQKKHSTKYLNLNINNINNEEDLDKYLEINLIKSQISLLVLNPKKYTGPKYPGKTGLNLEWIKSELIPELKEGRYLDKKYLIQIICDVIDLYKKQPSLVQIDLSDDENEGGKEDENGENLGKEERVIYVCGDIHGQFYDLLTIFSKFSFPSPSVHYLFNGDFVDRGAFSVECMTLLLCLKLLFPRNFHLNRGNHESRLANLVYGFMSEVMKKYDAFTYVVFIKLFYCLPLAHLINGKILVVHGGIFSEDGVTLEDVKLIDRFGEIPESGIMTELLWSDPSVLKGRNKSPRGVGLLFGKDVANKFLEENKIEKIIRSHECKNEGYDVIGDVLTVFSAPNYCDRFWNRGAVIRINSQNNIKISQFAGSWHPKTEVFKPLFQCTTNNDFGKKIKVM